METVVLRPRKRTSAYMYFCKDVRETSRNIKIQELSVLWNNLKADPSKKRELDYYYRLAKEDSDRYDREYEVFKEKNREVLNLNRVKKREESRTSRELEKLRFEEQKIQEKIQEKMRELETKIFTRSNGSQQMREPDTSQPKKKEIDMNLLLQKIQGDRKQSSSQSQREKAPSQPQRESDRKQVQSQSKPKFDDTSSSESESEYSDNDL